MWVAQHLDAFLEAFGKVVKRNGKKEKKKDEGKGKERNLKTRRPPEKATGTSVSKSTITSAV